jgi:hypothetical protein
VVLGARRDGVALEERVDRISHHGDQFLGSLQLGLEVRDRISHVRWHPVGAVGRQVQLVQDPVHGHDRLRRAGLPATRESWPLRRASAAAD